MSEGRNFRNLFNNVLAMCVLIKKTRQQQGLFDVRVEGLEPTCLAASDPKSDTSANFATPALRPNA